MMYGVYAKGGPPRSRPVYRALCATLRKGGLLPNPQIRKNDPGPLPESVREPVDRLHGRPGEPGAGPDAAVLHRGAERAIVNPMVQYPATIDRVFAALADPTRRAVLERLGSGSATVSELAEPFGMSLTGMKKHIRLLEEAQLVTTVKVGRVRRCMLAPFAFEGISTWLQRLDRFAQVVERTKGDP
jgi:DNA-binding transcriptional ArsR family regulator